jgi:hypothetical protein
MRKKIISTKRIGLHEVLQQQPRGKAVEVPLVLLLLHHHSRRSAPLALALALAIKSSVSGTVKHLMLIIVMLIPGTIMRKKLDMGMMAKARCGRGKHQVVARPPGEGRP